MTNYNKTVSTAELTPYRRTRYIMIRVPADNDPQVQVEESDAMIINGKVIEIPFDAMQNSINITMTKEEFSNTFDILNSETDVATGQTATAAQVFELIYSWVRSKQLARDAVLKGLPPVIS